MKFQKIGVLFVCLGNICRSPAAEGAFRHLVEERELKEFFHIDSCGTASYHIGELPHELTQKVARERGIILTHRARQFKREDFEKFDYILAMDESNYKHILYMAKTEEQKQKVHKFRKFDPAVSGQPDVPDPYYGSVAGFEHVQDIVMRTSAGFLDYLLEKHPHLNIPKTQELEKAENDV
ncbi:MAG: low molecular weight phosphotyrosine protein phosphatase [Leptospiraceae bacterium]|nr:low molecular weight phosphotyrosine protein phosphatase [Leptospiraceae bacterium]